MALIQDTLDSYKKNNIGMKSMVMTAKKMKERAERESYKAKSSIEKMSQELEEYKEFYQKEMEKYSKYKETLITKDNWIIKQGDEISRLRRKLDVQRKSMNSYKVNVEDSKILFFYFLIDFGGVLHEKETEILVLKEMVRSTKSMLRAKDIDISKLKKKIELNSGYLRSIDLPRGRFDQKQRIPSYKKNIALNPGFSIQRIKRRHRTRPNSFLRDKMTEKIDNFEQYRVMREKMTKSAKKKSTPLYFNEPGEYSRKSEDYEININRSSGNRSVKYIFK